jgi:hypothetical protein
MRTMIHKERGICTTRDKITKAKRKPDSNAKNHARRACFGP